MRDYDYNIRVIRMRNNLSRFYSQHNVFSSPDLVIVGNNMGREVKETKAGPVLGTDHLPTSIKLDVKKGVLRRPAKRRDSGRFMRVLHWSQLGRNTSVKDFLSDATSNKKILAISCSQITVTTLYSFQQRILQFYQQFCLCLI